jgi:hypothetical protein
MAAKRQGELGIWVISIAVAAAVATAAAMLVELPRRQELPKPRPGGGLGVRALEGDKLLAEQAELHDPMPLFLPSGWNSRPSETQASAPGFDPGLELARSFSGKLAYAEDSAAVEFPARTPIPARPADAVALGDPELPFLGIGRKNQTISAPPVRAAYMEVVAADTGKTVLAEPFREAKVPNASDWQPIELVVVVDRAGLVSPPAISRTSTVDSVDDFFRDYLERGLHLGERLAPGSYVVTIGR